jgi:hypothetical protein
MPSRRSPHELWIGGLTAAEMADEKWADIKREGELKDDFRPAIGMLFYQYHVKRTADRRTRRKVGQLQDAMTKATRLIDDLVGDHPITSRDFLYIGTAGASGPDLDLLVGARATFAAVKAEMAKTSDRFDKASELLFMPEYGVLEDFIFGLLFVQAKSREVTPPTSLKETTHNPKFRRYIRLCITMVEPEIKQSSIEYALGQALSAFTRFRKLNSDLWATNWDPSLRQENR